MSIRDNIELPPLPRTPSRLAQTLVATVGKQAAYRHLVEFARIAERYGGQRSSGTPGHEASVDYVVDRLTRAGLHISTQEFPITYTETLTERLVVGGRSVGVTVMRHSPDTPPGGLTGRLAVLSTGGAEGCRATDFAGADVTGKIVLIRRGECRMAVKQQHAAAAGAIAALVYNTTDEWMLGSLGSAEQARIPAGGISKADGEALLRMDDAPVTLEMLTWSEARTSRNVIAQTPHGRPDRVVMAGAHLDSVVEGPGINDAATGVSALLATAVKLGGTRDLTNAVRFGFWGAEEFGQVGSNHYVRELSLRQQRDIAVYLTCDMLGSTNAGYFVFDGSGGPPGSVQIQHVLSDYLATCGITAGTLSLIGGFDHAAFLAAGVPVGGLYTGATGLKTADQARAWGGAAGLAYDPGYHRPDDNLDNVDLVAFDRNLRAFAWAIGTYAGDDPGQHAIEPLTGPTSHTADTEE